ncbi:MFS transporter [Solwaraspora sp. WMMD792]|uniref:MFS transporter n=1 Tax=Solwaraspora sp. WMMD792 TaxID=3016099 RepID=UPI002416DF3C|nr:MFS transporter [Solwaraspora sp. WMMD792]MDG4773874.1 MFS transporter [Solwaraspora sp. WMMD792]
MSLLSQPRGDSYGGSGETVVVRETVRPLRSLRERQLALVVLCVGVLISVVDGSAVYVALPSIQVGLGFSQADLAWVVNAYLIPFGGLLLFAGRLGDLIGTKRVFLSGLGLFTAASVVCGLANDQAVLIGARFVQGVGGAFTTAVVLSMIVTMFPKPREQARALGFYAFVAASGAALGQLAGAALTASLSWHWIFFVNVPIGLVTILSAVRLLDNVRDVTAGDGIDWIGALALVGSLMLAVSAIVQADFSELRTTLLAGAALLLMAVFVRWQRRARNPLMPGAILRARNVAWSNIVLALMVAGPTAMFFLCALYLQNVLGFTVLELGFAFVPAAVAIGVGSLKIAPRLARKRDAKTLLLPAMGLMAIGLLLLARIPTEGSYWIDVLPALLLIGTGSGLATPPVLRIALADATLKDSGVRSGLLNTTQQLGSAIGLAVLAPVAANITQSAIARGETTAAALTDGFQMAFLVGFGTMAVAMLLAAFAVESEVPRTAPDSLDETASTPPNRQVDPTGAADPDFLAVGLGGTNMMAMLWSIASGRRAVGVELRGDPYLTLMQWKVRADLYHHLAVIDRMMRERYGPEGIPRRIDGNPFILHEVFYRPDAEDGAEARADEILYGWADSCVGGHVGTAEFVDDRWVDGKPHRAVTVTHPAVPSLDLGPDSETVGRKMDEVFAESPAFQVNAEDLLIMLRRYLEEIERMDLAAGREPRCRLFTYHRVAEPSRPSGWRRWLRREPAQDHGFVRSPDGRLRVQIEAIREIDEKGSYRRIRARGTEPIDLGTPGLIMIAEGVESADASRLGFTQEIVTIDHQDGRGPVVAQADYIVGLIAVNVGANSRQRIASAFDKQGNEYWVRQITLGHDGFSETGWTILEVPDYRTFDPIQAGMVPAITRQDSAEYFGAHRYLIRDYFLDQVPLLTEIPRQELVRTLSLATPKLVSNVERIGRDALVAPNCVVAGDSFGNGSFLLSGGSATGMMGHASRVLRYWQDRDAGASHGTAVRRLADGIREDTAAWLRASEADFAQPGHARAGTDPRTGMRLDPLARERILEETRRHRRSIVRTSNRLDDFGRLNVFPGRLQILGLRPLHPMPPEARDRQTDEQARQTDEQAKMATAAMASRAGRPEDSVTATEEQAGMVVDQGDRSSESRV